MGEVISEERKRIADTRRLVFCNLANGVPKQTVMATFGMSEKEVDTVFKFVGDKIAWYIFTRAMPSIPHSTITEVRTYRRNLFKVLDKIGPATLSSDSATIVHHIPVDANGGGMEYVAAAASRQQTS